MKTSARIQGAGKMLAKFRAHPALLNRTVESVLKQEARATAVEYASATMPGPGLQDGGKVEAFRKTIESDIRRVFATRANPNQIFRMLETHAPHLAKAYWHAHKSKKPRAMAEILRKANLPQGLNPADHKSSRTGKNGRVAKNQKPVSVANDAQLRVFVRKQRALAGFAKAGWACAAKGLGGRVRRNTRDATGGSRGTSESFPKYVRDIARKFPDAGGARLLIEGSRITVEIFTNVTHAYEALPERLYESATDRAQQKTALALTTAMQELNRRTFKVA